MIGLQKRISTANRTDFRLLEEHQFWAVLMAGLPFQLAGVAGLKGSIAATGKGGIMNMSLPARFKSSSILETNNFFRYQKQ